MKKSLNTLAKLSILCFLSLTGNLFAQDVRPVESVKTADDNVKPQQARIINTCCPPITPQVVAQQLAYQAQTPGTIDQPFRLRFQPTASFMSNMQTYFAHLNSISSGATTDLIVAWQLYDRGIVIIPGNNGTLLATAWSSWNTTSTGYPHLFGAPQQFFTPSGMFQYVMMPNIYYMVHTGTFTNNDEFTPECANNDIIVRLQVYPARGLKPVLEISDTEGKVIEKIELK